MNKEFSLDSITKLYEEKLSESKVKGVDKINNLNFKKEIELQTVHTKLNNGTYAFAPYLEILKSKGRNKFPRVISIPILRDRLVLLILKQILDKAFPECINRKLPNHFISDIKNYNSKYNNREIKEIQFMKLDIEKFYDRIQRDILLDKIKTRINSDNTIKVLSQAISKETVPLNSKRIDYPKYYNKCGIPQGLSISNILASIYLIDFDKRLLKRNYFYRRYVDDILIINDSNISKYRINNLESHLKEIGLNFNNDKFLDGKLIHGFDFLGYKIKGKTISVAEKNVQAFISRIAAKFTWFKNGIKYPQSRELWLSDVNRFKEVFIEELNDSITGIISANKNYGWIFYFSQINDKNILFKLDKIINSFFEKLEEFENKAPKNLKKLVRAYHVIKHQEGLKYLSNYDNYNTINKKRRFLILRGELDPSSAITEDKILSAFNKYTKKQVQNLEEDIGKVNS